ncbi:MAG: hypothetical protein EPN20_01855 [Magnetospirillum sp.]|nr:MAG: hypothetical protein EPN20_01855 [Magnetospirillum sp.]
MHPSRLILMMVALAIVTGCSSGDAFVERGYLVRSVKKQMLPGYTGQLVVCYGSDTPRERRDALAREACEVYGLQPMMVLERRWQCRFTVPHAADYACIDPKMRMPNGGYINPFSASQVEMWSKSRPKADDTAPDDDDQR